MTRLPASTVAGLLGDRANRLAGTVETKRVLLDDLIERGLPRSVLVEGEYELAMEEAELAWVRRTDAEIADGTMVWPHEIRLNDGTVVWRRTAEEVTESERGGVATVR